jgi:septal ring factor EnvC (AmiA/AmiB activator)
VSFDGDAQGAGVLPNALRAAVFALLLGVPAIVLAAPADAKKENLKAVQERIKSLRRDVSAAEKSRDSVADQLRATDTAISDTNRNLLKLAADRSAVEARLQDLENQAQRLGQQTSAQQTQLARLLNRQFAGGNADALALLLAGRDPNQVARDAYFLAQLAHAKANLIEDLRSAADQRQRLADAAREQHAQLDDIARRQEASRAQLLAQKKKRAAALAQLTGRIRSQKQEIASLRRDEQRLASLIEKLATARKKPPPRAGKKVGAGETAKKGAPAGKSYDPGRVGGAFAALRGKLKMPVAGQIASYFGSARADGGMTWKGLFIRAPEGEQVHAVAAGTIVFADWLRGFGNLLIIDHGDDFLSVYGNNESLLGAAGATITAGQVIAAAGNSGGNAESGLYFELRHRGQAFDPLKWIGIR